ncbi:MAG: hypothetical protein Q7R94_01680 [bacterium]|nr:hypothetical protein [bacterium]
MDNAHRDRSTAPPSGGDSRDKNGITSVAATKPKSTKCRNDTGHESGANASPCHNGTDYGE